MPPFKLCLRQRILLIAVLAGLPRAALSQASAVGARSSDYGLFAGVDLRFGDLMHEFGAFVGGHVAVLLKNRVYVGLTAGGLATDNAMYAPAPTFTPEPIGMGYAGILLGYVIPTKSLVHANVDVTMGAGGVDASRDSEESSTIDDTDGVFWFEPSATVEIKLTRFARVGVGASYRFVGDVDLVGMRDRDLRGVSGLVSIRLGRF